MENFRHGLVLGRFSPFHVGHSHLVRTASRACGRVTVLVLSRREEEIPAEVRGSWVRSVHPDVDVVLCSEPLADDPSDPAWRAAYAVMLRELIDASVDAVFTPEPVGAGLAALLGARWVSPDGGRRLMQVSGTHVRAAPERYWSLLPAPVRVYYVRRIAVLGTGEATTTELCQALGARLDAGIVTFAQFSMDDLTAHSPGVGSPAAGGQNRVLDSLNAIVAAASATTPSRWLILQSTVQRVETWPLPFADEPAPAAPTTGPGSDQPVPPAHLFTRTARLFVIDGGPDDPPHHRAVGPDPFSATLRARLVAAGVPWVIVRGDVEQRVAQILEQLPETQVRPLLRSPTTG